MTPEQREHLQEAWDRHLLHVFFEMKSAKVWVAVRKFVSVHPEITEPLHSLGLKRVPHGWQYKQEFTRWITCCLPKLAKILWDTDSDDVFKRVRILKKLKTSSLDTLRDGYDMKTIERTEMKRNVRQDVVSYFKHKESVNDMYAAYRRSNQWGVCK